MESVTDNIQTVMDAVAEQIEKAEAPAYDDSVILDLAKRRMAARRALIWQAIDFLVILFLAYLVHYMMHYSFYWSFISLISFILCVFLGIRLVYCVFKFAKPSFREGFRAYLRKRREQKLASECDRIKQMGAEYIADELSGK